MPTFRARLIPGLRAPYTTWTFLPLPPELDAAWRGGPHPVRGRLGETPFRGTASRGEGMLRVPLPRELLDAAGLKRGDEVEVEVEPDPEPRPVEVPAELGQALAADPAATAACEALPPAHRRAWAQWVGEAKREETRLRRAAQAGPGILARRFPNGG